jgi:hypothetical protein
MSRLSSSDQEAPEHNSNESVQHRNGAAGECGKTEARNATGTQGNSADHEADGSTPHADADGHDPSHMDRVEELMDQIGKKVGSFTSQVGVHLFRLVAHGREAAEDCWAEAQSIRRGDPQPEQPQETPPTS